MCLSVSVARDCSLWWTCSWADDMNRKIKDYVCLNEVRSLLCFVCARFCVCQREGVGVWVGMKNYVYHDEAMSRMSGKRAGNGGRGAVRGGEMVEREYWGQRD